MPTFTVPMHEHNDCHTPAGSPKGGQFCSKGSGVLPPGFNPKWGDPADFVRVYRGVTDRKKWKARTKGLSIWFSPDPSDAAAYAGAEGEGWVIAGYVRKDRLRQGDQKQTYFGLLDKDSRHFHPTTIVPAASFTKAQPRGGGVSRWLRVRGRSIARRMQREETGEAEAIRGRWASRRRAR